MLGIETPNQLSRDSLIGHIFENLIVIEVLKYFTHQGKLPSLYFYRDSNGLEADLLVPIGPKMLPIETKVSCTVKPNLLTGLKRVVNLSKKDCC